MRGENPPSPKVKREVNPGSSRVARAVNLPENPVEERVQIGEEMEEPTPVDSNSVRAALEKNPTRHLDGLNDSVAFLEDAQPLQNLVELLVEEEKEEDSDEETGPALDLDLTDLRDGILELLLEDWMQEDFAVVADDGLSVIYTLDPKVLCIDDEEEDMSEWSAEAIAEKEKEKEEEFEKCVARMEAHPLRLVATSDGTDRVSVSVQVDSDPREVFRVQVFPR